jgi:hypothetical protein
MVAPPCSCAIIISAALVISAISNSIATGDSPGRRSRVSLAVEEEAVVVPVPPTAGMKLSSWSTRA